MSCFENGKGSELTTQLPEALYSSLPFQQVLVLHRKAVASMPAVVDNAPRSGEYSPENTVRVLGLFGLELSLLKQGIGVVPPRMQHFD